MKFETIRCCICNSVLLNLPKEELKRLDSLTFRCESCGHRLILNGSSVTQAINIDSIQNLLEYDLNI
jgi:phage FluMu protein Com